MNTNKHKEKDFSSIIELLMRDYLSKNTKNLTQRTGEIVQDHINRGLYNSTICINRQLQTHYDHIDGLIDYIIESLKKDFANYPILQGAKDHFSNIQVFHHSDWGEAPVFFNVMQV